MANLFHYSKFEADPDDILGNLSNNHEKDKALEENESRHEGSK